MKLDKGKSYAQIIGSTDGSKFEQGGIIFDVNGDELNPEKKFTENTDVDNLKRRGRPPKGE